MDIQKLKFAAFSCMFWLLTAHASGDFCAHSDSRNFEASSWHGNYAYENGKSVDQNMQLHLTGAAFTGEGSDAEVGEFTVTGTYDKSTGAVSFVKQYSDHTVKYEGSFANGSMRGKWILPELSGTFQFGVSCNRNSNSGGKNDDALQSAPALLLQ